MMKKILSLILVCLFLVTGVLAATVTISPNPAHDRDDLTCAVDGKTSGFLYYWLINGNQAGSTNPLAASRTHTGDNVVCQVYAPSPFGEPMYMGQTSVKILTDNNAPTVSINSPNDNTVFGVGDSINFRASGWDVDSDKITYLWNFGDGSSSTGSNVNHVYTKEGSFKAIVTVTDSKGATGTDSVSLRVSKSATNHAPVVSISYPADADKFTATSAITFIAKATDEDGDVLTYLWNFGDGSTSREARPTHTYLKSGNYNVQLTVNDGKLTASDSVRLNVINKIYNVKDLHTYSDEYKTQSSLFYRGNALYAKFSVVDMNNRPISNLDVDAYMYNANSGSGRVYLSTFTGIADGTAIVNGEPLIRSNGNYYFKLNSLPLTDALLGRDVVFVIAYKLPNGGGQEQVYVTVLNNPVQLKDFPIVTVPLNSFTSLKLDDFVYDKETVDSQIKWSFNGNSNIKVSINPATRVATFSSTVPGVSERITFTANDGDGSIVSKVLTAKVTGGDVTTLDANIAGGDRVVYVGDNVFFDGSGSKGPITNFNWNFDDGSTANGRTANRVSHVFQSSGVYTVTLTVSQSGRLPSNSESVKVTVLDRNNEVDTNDNPVDDYSTEDREKKFAYMQGTEHNFDFSKLTPLYYQSSYNAGTNVRMVVELKNSGFADEDLELELYLVGENRQLFSDVHLDAGQNKIISASVFLPKDLESGMHVIKVVASNNEDSVQKIAYWPIVVTQ